MKIGIIAYRQRPYISANTAIAYVVGEQLVKTEEVVFLGRKQDNQQQDGDTYNDIRIRYLNHTPKDGLTWLGNKLVRLGMMRFAYNDDINELSRIIKDEKLDALICVTAPNDDAHIAMSTKLSIPVFLYQLDPFYNLGDTVNARNRKLFLKYLKRFSGVFTTQLLMQEYQKDNEIRHYLHKISVVQFPKLTEHADRTEQTMDRKRLLYAGTLYAGRKHSYLIDLKRALPENYDVVFCGKCESDSDLEELQNNGILCLGYCDQEKLEHEIAHSSMLINIGNLVHNQLPSKIIDYISTGKPIINIVQIDKCPSIDILKDYKYCLNIKGTDLIRMQDEIYNYCLENADKRLHWKTIRELYSEFTPEYAASTILKKIKA